MAQVSKSRETLEKEKKINLANIIQVRKILAETQKEKQNSLTEVVAITEQIKNQEKRIELANDDIELIKEEMKGLEKAQGELKAQLKLIQTDYAETLYRTSKNSNKLTKLGFLFSSSSITELFMRYKYLEQYTENRKSQLEQIKQIAEMLRLRQRTLLEKKIKQQTLVGEIKIEAKSLELLKERQNLIIDELAKKETDLRKEIETSKAAVNSLNSLISTVITKEQNNRRVPSSRRQQEAERSTNEKRQLSSRINKEIGTTPNPVIIENTEATIKVPAGSKFKNYKHKLSWPVEGFISDKFGVKNHPVLKGLKIDNNGVDIQTSSGGLVKSVFEGKVLDISQIPGLNNVVAIQHGDYYTVYANLSRVNVQINDTVNINQTIGTAAEKNGAAEINFQIWHNFDKLNPEPWLSPK